jgi:hypothetical protein
MRVVLLVQRDLGVARNFRDVEGDLRRVRRLNLRRRKLQPGLLT